MPSIRARWCETNKPYSTSKYFNLQTLFGLHGWHYKNMKRQTSIGGQILLAPRLYRSEKLIVFVRCFSQCVQRNKRRTVTKISQHRNGKQGKNRWWILPCRTEGKKSRRKRKRDGSVGGSITMSSSSVVGIRILTAQYKMGKGLYFFVVAGQPTNNFWNVKKKEKVEELTELVYNIIGLSGKIAWYWLPYRSIGMQKRSRRFPQMSHRVPSN